MDPFVAREIARVSHGAQRDRFGGPVIEHVERVAAAVPAEACAVALLHDVLEATDVGVDRLCRQGLTSTELAALQLLTRSGDQSFEVNVLGIEHAGGPAGQIARSVKLADLDDHIAHGRPPAGAPPYAWARLHIAIGRERYDGVDDRLAGPVIPVQSAA
jgi:hypothetical protein